MEQSVFTYSNSPMTSDNKHTFQYSKKHMWLISRIVEVFKNHSGIYVLGGKKGTGKTSIVERAREQVNSTHGEFYFLNLSFVFSRDHFCLGILNQIDALNIIRPEDQRRLDKIRQGIEATITRTQVHSESTGREDRRARTDGVDAEAKAGGGLLEALSVLSGHIRAKRQSSRDSIQSEKAESKSIVEYRWVNDREENYSAFIALLAELSARFKFIVVLDEIDKKSNEEIIEFVYTNKLLLLESRLLCFLLCDLYQALYLERHGVEYFNQILFLTNLTPREYVSVSRRLDIGGEIWRDLRSFYITKGNYRKLIHYSMHKQHTIESADLCAKAMLLQYLCRQPVFDTLPEQYAEALLDFFFSFTELLCLAGEVREEELCGLLDEFLEKNCINTQFMRLFVLGNLHLLKEPLCFPPTFFYDSISEQHTQDDTRSLANQCIRELFARPLRIYDPQNGVFSFRLLSDWYHSFDMARLEKENEYGQQLRGQQGAPPSFDAIVDRELTRHYVKDIKMDTYFSPTASQIGDIPLQNGQLGHNYIDTAIGIIENRRGLIIGVILFHPPYRDSIGRQLLNNGIIVINNGYDIYGVKYLGYPGLLTHKEWEFQRFQEYLAANRIFTLELEQSDFSHSFTGQDSYTEEEIEEIVRQNKNRWIKHLLREKNLA